MSAVEFMDDRPEMDAVSEGEARGKGRSCACKRDRSAMNSDCFLDLTALSGRSSISVRSLRDFIGDPLNPLPAYRPGGKILVDWQEFKAWVKGFPFSDSGVKARIDGIVKRIKEGV
ncbi:MAG: hypothetical protein JXL84_09235 [Deltaproteobacteria bacterium]|nr:hypothetical protein [Deltaproteobacteria bacterium]